MNNSETQDKIKLSQAVIVEGRYDKIRLSSFLDALILTTEGFRIFKDKQQMQMLRNLAKTVGLIILTDSDGAGFKIRNYIAGSITEGSVVHVYIPDVMGKEKRKSAPSKEGKLGVEGMKTEILRNAFQRAGILEQTETQQSFFTMSDLYDLGLMGGDHSGDLRRALLSALGFPQRLSTKAMLGVLNTIPQETVFAMLDGLRNGADENA